MNTFDGYIQGLETLVVDLLAGLGRTKNGYRVKALLDGEVAAQFRASVPLKTRRSFGAFFTSTRLARRLSRRVLTNIPPDSIIADPACGVGDLLLAAAGDLPAKPDLAQTLAIWGQRLMGFDIQPEFVRATKVRLLLLAMLRSPGIRGSTVPKLDELFPMICERDFLASPQEVATASYILINPPYNEVMAPTECTWGNRRVSAAALFVDACTSNASAGAQIGAILPDVLRSGSYYEKWRAHIDHLSENSEITTCGQFDNWTDVHVFILNLVKAQTPRTHKTIWWRKLNQPHNGRLRDYFNVHVGPVVPHRDPQKGPCVAYVHARTLPPWGILNRVNERRRFNGTLFQPPFVAVRRTSRPGDNRAIATIISGKRKVAVENHLIALFPNNGTVGECKQLLRALKYLKTDRWLDKRIRCRHLTVSALKDLPWWRVE
jgi:hypothetical protein